jgi:hypothetical protein
MRNLLIACFVLMVVTSAEARKIRLWTYPDLEKESDYAGIVEVTNVSLTSDKLSDVQSPEWYQGYLATLKPLWTKKGEIKNEDIKLRFFRYNEKTNFILNGASFVNLKEGGHYLVFLKAGSLYYSPVSGDYDAGFAIRLVSGAVEK